MSRSSQQEAETLGEDFSTKGKEGRVLVILPTYNEKDNIPVLLTKLSKVRDELEGRLEILFVDDGSPDGTYGVIEEAMASMPYVHVLERGAKLGLGTAYIDGFRYGLTQLGASILVQMDADMQHPPERIKPLVDAVKSGANVAIGSRYIPGGSYRGLNRRRRMISWGANWLARQVLGLRVHDATTGFKALDSKAASVLLSARLRSAGFIFQVESLYVLAQSGLEMVEVPFVFELRERGASKMSSNEVWEYLKSIFAIRFGSTKG